MRIASVCAVAIAVSWLVAPGAATAEDSAHARTIPLHDHIAARQFCVVIVHKEKEESKLSDERYVQLAHLCSHGHFHRVFTELGGDPNQNLVAVKGEQGVEVMQEWEREVRSAVAKAPHLDMK